MVGEQEPIDPGAPGGPSGSPSGGTPVVTEVVSLVDSLSDYLLARLRLEGFRLERDARRWLGRLTIGIAAGCLLLFGLFFASVGLAVGFANLFDSTAWGFGAVGGLYALAAGALGWLAFRRGRKRS